MVSGVSVTSANVAPSTVTHGRNRISRATFGDVLPFSVGAAFNCHNSRFKRPDLAFFLLSRIEERAIQKLRGRERELSYNNRSE